MDSAGALQLAIDASTMLMFERLVAELSARFMNVPAESIADAIREALQRISAAFDVGRSTFYNVGPDGTLEESISWIGRDAAVTAAAPAATRPFWAIERILAGEIVSFATLDEIADENHRQGYLDAGVTSAVLVPLSIEGRVAGAVGFEAVGAGSSWPPDVLQRLKAIASVFGQVLMRQQRNERLQTAMAEVARLKDELQAEHRILHETPSWTGLSRVVGQSAAVSRVMDQIQQVAATDSTVLLLGETGTGKELFATQLHELGSRRNRPMVRVNCAAIPTTLIESELFGREKGAFTGALAQQIGRFELADHSTIFLDEIGDLPADVQIKLLRVLEERRIERLGSPQPIGVDTRIIAATHQNLEQKIAEGSFREDLFYRLNVFPIRVPPLRERIEDVPLLVWRFVEELSKSFGKRVDSIGKENMAALQRYPWPGNIRELRNVVERAMIAATGPRLSIPVPQTSTAAIRRSPKLVDVEKEHIRAVLEGTAWRIRGPGGAAERLGLKPTTLETRMAKLGLKRPGHA